MDKRVVLTFDMIQLNKDTGDCIALLNGKETIVDPYVGCAWEYPYFKSGKITFEGIWHYSQITRAKVFLPNKQIQNNEELQDIEEQLCSSCRKRLL